MGLRHKSLIQILSTKALSFAIPGVAVGLIFAQLATILIADKIFGFANLEPDTSLSKTAVVMSVILGAGMALLGNIAPIARALSRTLRDSLDVYHHVTNSINVRVMRLSE